MAGSVGGVDAAFDQQLSQFFDEERHPIGPFDDPYDRVIRYVLAGKVANDVGAVRLAKAVQLQQSDMIVAAK